MDDQELQQGMAGVFEALAKLYETRALLAQKRALQVIDSAPYEGGRRAAYLDAAREARLQADLLSNKDA